MRFSGVLGWVFPGIDVSYSAADQLLFRYEGLSELRSQSGDNLHTTIIFRPEDRRTADARAYASWIGDCGDTRAIPIISGIFVSGGGCISMAVAADAWWSIVGPLIMSLLLMRVSLVTRC